MRERKEGVKKINLNQLHAAPPSATRWSAMEGGRVE